MINKNIKIILYLLLILTFFTKSLKANFYNDNYAGYIYYVILTSSVSVQVESTSLCVYGNKQEYSFFDSINNKKLHGENNILKVTYINKLRANKLKKCNAIYLPHKYSEKGQQILNIVKNDPILTIGEKDFAWKGGVISLYWRGKKIQFTVNLKSLKMSGIRIDAPILKMAHLIEE